MVSSYIRTVSRTVRQFGLAIVLLSGSGAAALAAPITLPAGQNPGDSYRLAFVTSIKRGAEETDINAYNTFVNNLANGVTELAALSTTWSAIASTSAIDARDNTNTNPGASAGVPIYLTDGITMIADDNADLWDGDIDNLFNIDENGNTVGVDQVWTGSVTNGTGNSGNELGSNNPITGATHFPNAIWITVTAHPNTAQWRMYAISDTITIPGGEPDPEIAAPGQVGLLILGIAGVAVVRRRKHSRGSHSDA